MVADLGGVSDILEILDTVMRRTLCLRWQVAREMFVKDRQLQEEKEAEERRQRLEAQRKEEERIRKAEEHRLATQKVHNCNLYTFHIQCPSAC